MTSRNSSGTGRASAAPPFLRNVAGAGLLLLALWYTALTLDTLVAGDVIGGLVLFVWSAVLFAGAHRLVGGRG